MGGVSVRKIRIRRRVLAGVGDFPAIFIFGERRFLDRLPRRAYSFAKATAHKLIDAVWIGNGGVPGTADEPIAVEFVVGVVFRPLVAET